MGSVSLLLLRWRWLIIYFGVSVALAAAIAPYQSTAPSQSILASDDWWGSDGIHALPESEIVRWRAAQEGVQYANTIVAVPDSATSVRLRACIENQPAADTTMLMLASVAQGALDFNRQYALWSAAIGDGPGCFEDVFPRHRQDGVAVVQIQLQDIDDELALSLLEVTPLTENLEWRITRQIMLLLGVALIVMLFAKDIHSKPRPIAWFGLLGVAVILFGCTVSTDLKADIYALFTGGRSIPIQASVRELLETVFPIGGFSIFTYMHAILFAGTTFVLSLVRPRAWMDLLLLAPITETLQIFVPGRGPGVLDMMVDWQGVLVGAALAFLFRRSGYVSRRVRLLLEQ